MTCSSIGVGVYPDKPREYRAEPRLLHCVNYRLLTVFYEKRDVQMLVSPFFFYGTVLVTWIFAQRHPFEGWREATGVSQGRRMCSEPIKTDEADDNKKHLESSARRTNSLFASRLPQSYRDMYIYIFLLKAIGVFQ